MKVRSWIAGKLIWLAVHLMDVPARRELFTLLGVAAERQIGIFERK